MQINLFLSYSLLSSLFSGIIVIANVTSVHLAAPRSAGKLPGGFSFCSLQQNYISSSRMSDVTTYLLIVTYMLMYTYLTYHLIFGVTKYKLGWVAPI